MDEEKTEKPTPRKRRESRKEGQVPRTQEFGAWSALLVFGLALPPLLGHELRSLRGLLAESLALTGEPSTAKAIELLGRGLTHTLLALLVLGGGVLLIGVSAALAQGGFFLATKSVKPSWGKLSPLKGAKRIFGTQALWEGLKTVAKVAAVGMLAYTAMRSLVPLLGGMVPVSVVLQRLGEDALSLLRSVAVAGLVMAAADYGMARRRTGKQTRMSHQEIKQEHKQTEGDPLVKSAIRSRQLAAARSRMMSEVPTADVVLVNPTHIAVALRYDPERGAPRVVALGAGVVAGRIREKAAEAGVAVVRDIPLARALHRSTRVGQEIPPELFAAVAQVLAFVIGRHAVGQRGGEHHSPRHGADLPAVLAAHRRGRDVTA